MQKWKNVLAIGLKELTNNYKEMSRIKFQRQQGNIKGNHL